MFHAQFSIMVREIDGTEYEAFRWTRDEASGIRRAYSDAAKFGIELASAWAVAL